MAASITKGQTFGATEQVTNTKLHNLVDLATISNISATELASNILQSLPTGAGQVRYWSLVTSMASGALVRFNGTNGLYASMT